jgi:peptidyl-dipeptidase Dcp
MGWRILLKKLKQELFSLDDEKLNLIFNWKVLDGAFTIASIICNFYQSFDIDKYHEEVTTYEVTDEKAN